MSKEVFIEKLIQYIENRAEIISSWDDNNATRLLDLLEEVREELVQLQSEL